jgi:hypothetical protein
MRSETHHLPASKTPAKKRGINVKPTVAQLASAIYEHGINEEQLGKLLDLICTPSYLDQASLNALLNNLYPATSIQSDHILKLVGCLGQGELKPSYSIQAGLLRWLVMVYHVIQEPVILSHAYAVLFNLLETAAIRYVRLFNGRSVPANSLALTDHNCATCWRSSHAGNMCGHSEFRHCKRSSVFFS